MKKKSYTLFNFFIGDDKPTNIQDVRIRLLDEFGIEVSVLQAEVYLKLITERFLNDSELDLAINLLNSFLSANEKREHYHNEDLYNLFRASLVEAQSRNNLGGWSIEKQLLSFINSYFKEGAIILEFGSGLGTEALLQKYEVVSIEHDKKYVYSRSPSHSCFYSPIVNGWYDRVEVAKAINLSFDLLLIDGPPGELRGGVLNNLDLFSKVRVPIIFDDMDRQFDRKVMIDFCERLFFNYVIYDGENKKFAFCTPKDPNI